MYNRGLILTIIVVFVVLATLPFWYGRVTGGTGQAPKLELPADKKQCIEVTEYMRKNHVDLLQQWRDAVVREGKRIYTAHDGKRYEMSLTGTCLECHSRKANFCDRCHNYVKVKPTCWECHNEKKTENTPSVPSPLGAPPGGRGGRGEGVDR